MSNKFSRLEEKESKDSHISDNTLQMGIEETILEHFKGKKNKYPAKQV